MFSSVYCLYSDISLYRIDFALGDGKLCVKYDLFAGQSVVGPLETGFSSLHEVFALWASPSVTYEPLNVTAFTRSSLAQSMAIALDDEV